MSTKKYKNIKRLRTKQGMLFNIVKEGDIVGNQYHLVNTGILGKEKKKLYTSDTLTVAQETANRFFKEVFFREVTLLGYVEDICKMRVPSEVEEGVGICLECKTAILADIETGNKHKINAHLLAAVFRILDFNYSGLYLDQHETMLGIKRNREYVAIVCLYNK